MQHTVHSIDITLLRENKDEFILRCQQIIKIIVKIFIGNGLFNAHHIYDIIQTVNEELIKRLPGVEKNFNGKVLLITYINVVIRNICLDIYNSELHKLNTISIETHEQLTEESEIFQRLSMSDELHRFSMIIKLYNTQIPKIILCLKVYFRLPISEEEMNACFPWNGDFEKDTIGARLRDIQDDTLEIDNFNLIAPLMNKREGKGSSGDSLRRWTQEHLQKIITVMNGKSIYRSHTKETIKTLFEHYIFGTQNL